MLGVIAGVGLSVGGGGLTPLLVVPLAGAFFGGAVGMLVPEGRRLR
jgi:hypothetical protein